MKVYLTLLAGIWVSFNSPCAQIEKQAETPILQKCLDNVDLGGMKNSQWLSCYTDEFYRQDKVLNNEYKKLILRTPKTTHKQLVAGQRSWIKFREEWCAFEEKLPMDPNPFVNKAICFV